MVWIEHSLPRNYDQWTWNQRDRLFSMIEDLEAGREILPDDPPELNGIYLDESDAWNIYLAHVAHSLWLDVNEIVSWNLVDFSERELEYLLDVRRLMKYDFYGYRFATEVTGRVTAWNPRVCYRFLSHYNIIRESQRSTLYALTDWMRSHLVHYGRDDDIHSIYNYPGPPPIDRILYPPEPRPHLTAGCWGTTGIYYALLKSLNIPVKAETTDLEGDHSRPEFVSLDMSMPHSDDVYSQYLQPVGGEVPPSVCYYTMEEMNTYFFDPALDCGPERCNSRGEQASYNSNKNKIINSFRYGSYYFLNEYAKNGEADVGDSLRGFPSNEETVEYALPFFTPEEIDEKIDLITQRLMEIGGGDIEAGKSYVMRRMTIYSNNKLNIDE
ncbi:MAG: hypothetical protein JW881_14535 [Spirochaetales bacterium]|nr:hypothetical protein [Spirochaetales bacterium]